MFIPRHPVVENQFCQFAAQTTVSGGAGDVLAYAGSVVYLDSSQNDATVKIFVANEAYMPFGFLMQKVKTGYHTMHPPGFFMPGDLGSSDVIAQPSYNSTTGRVSGSKAAPVGVAHLGIWDTIHYTNTTTITAGMAMKVVQSSMSEIGGTGATVNDNSGTGATVVAYVVKGASAAQVAANIANTTLYPIRVKLMV